MSKKKLQPEERKIKLSISIDNLIYKNMNLITNNRSKFIEELIREYLNYKNEKKKI